MLSDVQHALSVKTNELHAAQTHITQLEQSQGEEPEGEGLGGEPEGEGLGDEPKKIRIVILI